MKRTSIILIILLAGIASAFITADPGMKAAKKLGWELGLQAYTFRKITFEEALDKANDLGLKNVEAYSKHILSSGDETATHFNMDQGTRGKLEAMLKEKGINLLAYGVISGNNEKEWEEIFQFAKEMGVKTISTEPAEKDLDLVEKLCEKYKINAAIHNHPRPSHYWNPETVVKALEGRSERMGACPDVGHWMRSGLDPVEGLKMLEGRILMLHLKDLNEMTREAHDVPWGTGAGNVPAMLRELKRQEFRGPIHIEYEYHEENPFPEVKECIANFYRMVGEL